MAETGKVLFRLTDDALIVANSGAAFTRAGVIAVCYSCLSPKSSNPPEDTYKENGEFCADGRLPAMLRGELLQLPVNVRKTLTGIEGQTAKDYAGRFELELLQNADDAVGRRTAVELIGSKGMGFKSILEITDAPEIHSGDFHFRLESAGDGFRAPAMCRPIAIADFSDAAAVIRLPFRDEESKKLARRNLTAIGAETLLFCQRLSRVEIQIHDESVRALEIERGDVSGLESGDSVFTLRENGASQKWRRWSSVWTPQSGGSEKRLSVALCLPIGGNGERAMDEEKPAHVFFPTNRNIPGLKALIHASYELQINRKDFLENQRHGEEIRDEIGKLAAVILGKIPPLAALRAFGEIPRPKDGEAEGEIARLQNVLASAVADTAFVPTIGVGGGLVKPSEARLWEHGLGDVLSKTRGEVSAARLLDSSLACNSEARRVLKQLGAESINPPKHADLLRHCKNDSLEACLAAWKVAGDIARKMSKEDADAAINALKNAPIWWTDAGTPRPLNGDTPLLLERPDKWPDWLKADEVAPKFRRMIKDDGLPKKQGDGMSRQDALKSAGIWPLGDERSYFTDALLPFCEGKNAEWWDEMGWEVLFWALRWGGKGGKPQPFLVGLKNEENRIGGAIRAPTDKGWLPAIQCYAGKAWDGPESFDEYFQGVKNRGVLTPMETWKLPADAESDMGKWKEFLRGLGVSWSPKMLKAALHEVPDNDNLVAEYKGWCLKEAHHATAHLVTGGESVFIEHFPASLAKSSSLAICRMIGPAKQLAETPGETIVKYRHQSGPYERGFSSFAMFQLRRCEWLPCRPGLFHPANSGGELVMVRPEDAFMPECGLGKVVPVVKRPDGMLPDEWGSVYGALKELGVRTEKPASTDKEWWRKRMGKLAQIFRGSGEPGDWRWKPGEHGDWADIVGRLYAAYNDTLQGMGEVPYVRKTDNGEFVRFAPFGGVRWADKPYHEDMVVRRELLERGFKLFPFFLRKGALFEIKPLSDFVGESPEAEESSDATNTMRFRFDSRVKMLALAAGKPECDFALDGKIQGCASLVLVLTRQESGEEIARPEVDFHISDGRLHVNAGGNIWRALAAGIAAWHGLPEKAAVFEGLLGEENDEECRKRLRRFGISDAEIDDVAPENGTEENDTKSGSGANEGGKDPGKPSTPTERKISNGGSGESRSMNEKRGGSGGGGGGGGEGDAHRMLKERIAESPKIVGLPESIGQGETEHEFSSGDKADVFFKTGDEWIAVEVKSERSGTDDVKRGLFQCVKYKAVMDAEIRVRRLSVRARAILALGGVFPQELEDARKILDIDVRENLNLGVGGAG